MKAFKLELFCGLLLLLPGQMFAGCDTADGVIDNCNEQVTKSAQEILGTDDDEEEERVNEVEESTKGCMNCAMEYIDRSTSTTTTDDSSSGTEDSGSEYDE